MTKPEIIEWLGREFLPLKLATPIETLSQQVDTAIRYWNTHSAYPVITMHQVSQARSQVIDIPPVTKSVYKVYPSSNPTYLYANHPTWTLTGISVIDGGTTNLIEMASSFQHYKTYLGGDFNWKFIQNFDPTQNSQLHLFNIPSRSATHCAVLGARRILPNENITCSHILEWLLSYCKALLKQSEGNILRKAKLINADSDGQQIYDEGVNEKKELEERLGEEGRWLVMAKRW